MENEQLVSFIDASGNFDEVDRFFGVGMLTVENPGPLTDKLQLVFQRTLAISQSYRDQRLQGLISASKFQEAILMLKKTKRFELKYDRISPVKFAQYKEMIRIFLNSEQCRFSCMVIDRKSPEYNSKFFSTMWDTYTSYISTLVVPELCNFPNSKMFLVLDEVPKPKTSQLSLEETVIAKVEKRVLARQQSKGLAKINGAIRIESHSNLLMQLTDVLLGCTMFEFKKKAGLVSENLKKQKEEVVKELLKGLNKSTLSGTFTEHKPVYFHVWEANWGK